ncbi:hypothetical protein MNBD_CPR01-576, partial [hydrothermal vent metagenome]
MEVLQNLDLLSVGVTVAATVILGFTAYFSDKKSVTNRAFLFFSIMTAFWGMFTYAEYRVPIEMGLWFIRVSLFFAVWQSYTLFLFFSAFPKKRYSLGSLHKYVLIPIVAIASVFTLTPYVLNHVASVTANGSIASIRNGWGFFLFVTPSIVLIVLGLWIFFRKLLSAKGDKRHLYIKIQTGTLITFALIITFNMVLPAFFNNTFFIVFSSVFVFPFVSFTAYSILYEHLFNIKVATTATLVFILSVVSFGEIIFSDSAILVAFRMSVFVLVLVFGITLIRSVVREVRQREEIQKLADALRETNERQEALIHFVGHEVKGYLAKDMGVFSTLEEGDMGDLPKEAKTFVAEALKQVRAGARSVMSILQAANLKKGTVSYKMKPFDLEPIVRDIFSGAETMAKNKGLDITLSVDSDGRPYTMIGDAEKIGGSVLRNIIENAINYTPNGSVIVSLLKNKKGDITFNVKDTGIGITDEDKKRLFTEGGHGKDSIKINAHSTGYGLFIAKQVIKAHKG